MSPYIAKQKQCPAPSTYTTRKPTESLWSTYRGDVYPTNRPQPVWESHVLDRPLTYSCHMSRLGKKVSARSALIRPLAGTEWGADQTTIRTSTLALVSRGAKP